MGAGVQLAVGVLVCPVHVGQGGGVAGMALGVSVGVGGGGVPVGVGVPHWQQLLYGKHHRTLPSGQLVGFCTQRPHGYAGQLARIVGQGLQLSAQYGVPVGAHVGVGVGVYVGVIANAGVEVGVSVGVGTGGGVSGGEVPVGVGL